VTSRVTVLVVVGLGLVAECAAADHVPITPRLEPSAVELRTESQVDPVGIDTPKPRLSWQLRSTARGVMQSAYQVRVAFDEGDLPRDANVLFDSGKISSGQSVLVPYEGPPVESTRRYFWQVRVWDQQGRRSDWSRPAHWEMGLLSRQDWRAQWIDPGLPEDPEIPGAASMLRTEFHVRGKIAHARVYATARGVYELHLNGKRVGDAVLAPGWTSYQYRLQYQTYDVTGQLREGNNAIGAILGDGWYRGYLTYRGKRHHYGDSLALLLQLEIDYADGRRQTVTSTADNWRASTGPIRASDLYMGETYDARLEHAGWDEAGFDGRNWSPVKRAAEIKVALIAQIGPPVRRREELKPVRIFKSPAGSTIADMGQNMVGWVRLKVEGPAGTEVTLRHAEALDKEGNLYTENLRTARQTVVYILKGGREETYEPHFTFQGFRYVEIEGFPGEPTTDSLTGIVIQSDVAPTGTFETSDALVNQLQHNIVWSQKGNSIDIPTDCPQRDEREGWTGDAQVFSATATYNLGVDRFYEKWLGDLALEQHPNGSVTHTVPDVRMTRQTADGKSIVAAGAAGWGDAATIIPWNLYLAYGDTQVLQTQYASMIQWVEYEHSRAGADHVWRGDFQFGDWLDYFSTTRTTSAPSTSTDLTATNVNLGSTPADLVATAYYAHSVDLVAKAARVLDKADDASRYEALFSEIKAAFVRQFVTPDDRVGQGTQTAYVLALDFDLLPQAMRARAAQWLAEDVRQRGHLTTGFLGTPRLLPVLSRFGYLAEGYMLLNRKAFPSWLYPITRGATTIWERWDGIRPDGSFQSDKMNSFNHYAYGAVGAWMYSVMAGIDTDPSAPGYKHSLLSPQPGGGFTYVKGSLLTAYGRLSTAWQIDNGRFTLTTEVPPNTSATVRLPHARTEQVLERAHPLKDTVGIEHIGQEVDAVLVEVGSGRYTFTYPWEQ
jgi:alpha-L-rhamnosidase